MESNFFKKAIILIGLEKHKETDNRKTEVYLKKKKICFIMLSHSKGERNFTACVISLENSAR